MFAIARAFPRVIYNAGNLGFNRWTASGASLVAGSIAASVCLSDETKERIVSTYTSVIKKGVSSGNVSENEIRGTLYQSGLSLFNCMAASPFFYFGYNAIHKSGLPFVHHISRAGIKGVTGTLNCALPLLILYGVAAVALPLLQNQFMKCGYTKQEAAQASQAAMFLGAGTVMEFGVEAVGCGVKPSQLRFFPSVVGLTFLVGRLGAGVLLQFKVAGAGAKKTKEEEYKDLAITLAGTTVTQHGINAVMQTLTHDKGMSGIAKYWTTGNVSGNGSLRTSGRQLSGTLLQRVMFVVPWNFLSHQQYKAPAWASTPV